MPLQTTITNLTNKPLRCSWIPPHSKTLPASGSITVRGDVVNYHLFPIPNWRTLRAIFRISTGENKKVTIVTENV